MADMEKKMAAALAAVSAYMQQEQEIYAEAMRRAATPAPPARQQSPWGIAGRQDMMGMRNLMQMKAFNRMR